MKIDLLVRWDPLELYASVPMDAVPVGRRVFAANWSEETAETDVGKDYSQPLPTLSYVAQW